MKKRWLSFALGILFIVLSSSMFAFLNVPTLHEQKFKFASTYGEKSVTMHASLWEAEDAEYAVLICPGYSCDRRKWRPFSNLFVENGYTTMTIDYAGQGASTGTIGFDNAKTDSIPVEIDDALALLHEKTDIDYDHIILMGHSMGGRSILRLIQDYNNPKAETTVEKKDVRNVILFSPGINYAANMQASLFARTSDNEQEPWCSFNESYIEGVNVYLFGSTADDIVFDEDILEIFRHLGAKDIPASGTYEKSTETSLGSKIRVGVTSGILHSYQMYSTKFARYVNSALTQISGKESTYKPEKLYLVYAGWVSALLGLFFLFNALSAVEGVKTQDTIPVLLDEKKFLRQKLFQWIFGILWAFVLCCVCVAVPFGSPVMNIPYMCFIAGYGVAMLLAYRKGKFKGTQGKLPKPDLRLHSDKKKMIACTVCVVLTCLFAWYVMDASMYALIPWNTRIFWLIFASVLMAVGYYISGTETDMLENADVSKRTRTIYGALQYIPLLVFVLFYLIIKSYSGLIGQAVNVVLMYIFCIPLGNFVRRMTGNRLYSALLTAVVFQGMMITSAAMISMF